MAPRPSRPDPHHIIPRSRPPIAASPPLIGIVTHELRADDEPAWALAAGRRERDLAPQRLALRLTYSQAIQEAGGLAVVVPAHGFVDDTAALLDRLDGLVFSGGPDVDPAVYGHERHPQLGPDVDRAGDEYELAMHAGAAERDLPVLAICRGMQTLNVARGGTLHQHLPETHGHHEHRREAGTFDGADHDVRLAEGSLASRVAGEVDHATKSHHHQGIDRVGDGFTVTGWAVMDELPEAMELESNRFAVGVQWHPEADETSRFVAALVAEAAAARSSV